MKKSGAELLIEGLRREGVEVIFGYPGGAVLPIFDVLYDTKEIKFILTRHEQGAVHAADGYARASGKVGVCIATSGPGATNLVTGIATAYMDSIPIVALTGQVPTTMIGNDAFQEVDILGITRPIVKHSYLVRDPRLIPQVVKEAFYIARTSRPGPVLIDLPRDVTSAILENPPNYPDRVYIRGYNPKFRGHSLQIKKAKELMANSKRPIIYAGGGVISSGASPELIKLVDKTNIPVVVTLLGLGGFPASHKSFLGMVGMHGAKYANLAISHADLIIAVGARFDDRVTGKVDEFAPEAKIIHIDIDPSSISKNIEVDVPIVGDARLILQELNKLVVEEDVNIDIEDWLEKIEDWKREYPLTYKKDDKLRPQYVVECIYELTNGEAIITTEVGQNQMWTAQYYKFEAPRRLLSSGGLGTMGYGFPAAIGAAIACPDKIVFDIAGDGSFQMNIQELATAVYYNLAVKVAILNNQYLGMVRQWQELFYKKRYSYVRITGPDFVRLAQAYGGVGILVKDKKEVRAAIKSAIENKRPTVIDFRIEEEENVFPMVPAGAALTQMIEGMA